MGRVGSRGPPDWQVDDEDSQLEAITYVGDSTVAIMREDPSLITVGDPITGQVTAQITLVVSDAAQLPWDDAGSRGEGLVLLSDGRLLVAKEKDPAALIIFAPPGAPTGLAAADLLDVGTAWDAPAGAVDFEAVAIWPLAGRCGRRVGRHQRAGGRPGSIALAAER